MGALLAVGTRKGLFLGRSQDRVAWSWTGPLFAMTEVAAVGIDTRREPVRILVGGRHEHWGPVVARSDDLGATWQEDEQAALRFPADTGAAVARVWQLQPGPASRPDEVWAGVEPAALFRSEDGGRSFALVRGLWDHPHRERWFPGFGGLALHTVVPHPHDPQRVLVAVSAGGVYRTRDGGASWEPANHGIEVDFLPDRFPEYGQCVHKMAAYPGTPDRLVMQHHGGVYRSDDWAGTWRRSQDGLPADFGFGLALTGRAPASAYLFPVDAAIRRFPPDARARVYRSDDEAATWHDSSAGLPQEGFHSIVLRDALTTDDGEPAGVYLGTRSGEVWASPDGGGSWRQAAGHLADVLCVRAVTV